MRAFNILTLTIILCIFFVPAMAQKKPVKSKTSQPAGASAAKSQPLSTLESAMKNFNEAKALQVKHFNSNDAKAKNLMVTKYREAGKNFLKSDSFKNNSPEKLYVQAYATQAYGSAMFFMRQAGKDKEVLDLADEIKPKLWLQAEKLPAKANKLLKSDTSDVITSEKFNQYRVELFEEVMAAAEALSNYAYQLRYGPLYLRFLPEPGTKSDKKLFDARFNTLMQMANSSIKLRNGDSCRKYVGEPFQYIVNNRSLVPDRDQVLKSLRAIDTTLSSLKYNYTDFDNDAKVRATAARAFDRLDDHKYAYKLYDATIRAGNRSLSLYMARAESAAAMEDMEKLDVAILAIDEKMYVGKMNSDYEKRIKEYKKLLKKE